MEKNENGKYECVECGKEFNRAGSCALHQRGKHGIGKSNGESGKTDSVSKGNKNNEETSKPEKWEFLGKKDLVIKGRKFDVKGQIELKHKHGVFEVNTETGALR